VATAQLQLHTLEHVERRAVYGVGRVLRPGRTLDVAEMRIFDETGRLVAFGTGTFVPQRRLSFAAG
jgi:acyl-coenzyme A thioesterase PaaI-like protein